ncbi:MAG: hypothetical protein OEZ06_09565 [Myxococcales bacterium]|nr:hypothetical protein [Myxococcales bacterium]
MEPRSQYRPPPFAVAIGTAVAVAIALLLPNGAHGWHRSGALEAEPAIRGVTVGPIESSQQPGRGYGTAYSAELLDELVRLGANAISITPFGRLWNLDSTEILMDFEEDYERNRAAVGTMIAQARQRGLRVLVIPHLWVESGGWRGEIDPGSPEGWLAYQASYREFLLRWARDAAAFGADALSIGVECKSWSGRYGKYWTDLIAEVRRSFPGSLTYSSNWDEVEGVLFWEQLDWVGVNAFYPLADRGGADYATYRQRADAAVAQLVAIGDALERPIVLVEIGYTTRRDSAVEPWLWPDSMQGVQVDEWEQARALLAIASAAASDPRVRGFFVWRYYANLDDVSQEAIWGFSPHGKLAERVLRGIFQVPWAADPMPLPWQRWHYAPGDQLGPLAPF